jgi:hypothetical protein
MTLSFSPIILLFKNKNLDEIKTNEITLKNSQSGN